MTLLNDPPKARVEAESDSEEYAGIIPGQSIFLPNVSWETYCALVDDVGEDHIRITFDNGRMEIMSPRTEHDPLGRHVYRLLDELAMEIGLDVFPTGGTTFRSKRKRKGAEPDESFYIHNIDAIRRVIEEHRHYDDEKDPPPDLVFESEVTNPLLPKLATYAALGVPEIWRHDGKCLRVLLLKGEQYIESQRSGLFPFLPMDEFFNFTRRLAREGSRAVIPGFREWVRALER